MTMVVVSIPKCNVPGSIPSCPGGIIDTIEESHLSIVPVKTPPMFSSLKINRTIDTSMFHLHALCFGEDVALILDRMMRH